MTLCEKDKEFETNILACSRCERLRHWCEKVSREKVLRFRNEAYWGKPVPSFGSLDAELLIIGLAPAAHGANRTGRMFTGDRSGEWLFRALLKFGLCTQSYTGDSRDDLRLVNVRITAVVHCAPPNNKPATNEIENCSIYLHNEIAAMKRLRIVLLLGSVAYRTFSSIMAVNPKDIPAFNHGAAYTLATRLKVIASYHPSQQNTFTRRLTEEMFDSVFERIKGEIHRKV